MRIELGQIEVVKRAPTLYALVAARSMRRKRLLNKTDLWDVLLAWSSHPEKLRES